VVKVVVEEEGIKALPDLLVVVGYATLWLLW